MSEPMKTITVQYFALLREARGCAQEMIETTAATPLALYQQLQKQHHFHLEPHVLRVAVNETFVDWESPLQDNDLVVFIPPVAGG